MTEATPLPDRPSARLSYSRVSKWETCPKSYQFSYVDRLPRGDAVWALVGTVVHATLETLEREALARGVPGSLSLRGAAAAYKAIAAREGLVGVEPFTDGWQMVQDWVVDRGWRDPTQILGLELPFTLRVGRFEVVGVVDRIERVAPGVIKITDYKSGRNLFRAEDLSTNLQLSLYEAAVRDCWPDTREVHLAMWMLRHRQQQRTQRTPEQLDAALAYAETIGEQIESATEYPARLGPHCGYCDFRTHCETYRAAVGGELPAAQDLGDLEHVARERERLVTISRLADRRQREIDRGLKKRLAYEPELVAGGTRFRLFEVRTYQHDLAATAERIARATGQPPAAVIEQIGAVDKDQLSALLDGLAEPLGRARAELLRHEINALATERLNQRLWAAPASRGAALSSTPKESVS